MTRHTHSMCDSARTEYTIYTFQRGEGKDDGPERWQKQDTLDAMPAAIQKAEALYESGQYSRVEIKQKCTNPKNSRIMDTTLKTFETKEKKSFWSAATMTVAAACGGIAFALVYYLGQS